MDRIHSFHRPTPILIPNESNIQDQIPHASLSITMIRHASPMETFPQANSFPNTNGEMEPFESSPFFKSL